MKSGKAPYVSPEDFLVALDAQRGLNATRNRVALLLTYMLGLRAKEAAALRVKDVWDYRKGEPKKVVRLLGSMTKGNKYREVFITDTKLRECLTELLATRLGSPDGPVLMSQKGGAFTPDTMQKMLAQCWKKARIYASSHSGRRSFATNLIRNGADIYSVKQMMGHTSIATTEVYFSSDPNLLMAHMERMSQSIHSSKSG